MRNEFGDMTMRVSKQSSSGGSVARRSASLLRGAVTLLIALTAAVVEAAVVEDIRFASLPNDVTEIRLYFDGPAPEPAGYTIDQPARIAIDLMDATSALDSKYHTLGTGNTRSVTVIEAADRTRMIINLTELVGYEARVDGNSLVVRVGTSVAGGNAAPLDIASRPAARAERSRAGASKSRKSTFAAAIRAKGRSSSDSPTRRRPSTSAGKAVTFASRSVAPLFPKRFAAVWTLPTSLRPWSSSTRSRNRVVR